VNIYLKSASRDGKHYRGVCALPPYFRRRVYELVYTKQEWELCYTELGIQTVVGVFATTLDGAHRGCVLGMPARALIRSGRAELIFERDATAQEAA
jgi:hypothetical protein